MLHSVLPFPSPRGNNSKSSLEKSAAPSPALPDGWSRLDPETIDYLQMMLIELPELMRTRRIAAKVIGDMVRNLNRDSIPA